MDKHLLFVYGTLRKNESNSHFLKHTKCVAEQAWTNGVLYDTELGYPTMRISNSKCVYGEVYEIEDEQLKQIDKLEDFVENRSSNFHDRITQKVYTDQGELEAYVYVASDQLKMVKKEIPLGDWKEYGYYSKKDNFYYFAYGSCLDDARFKLAKVDHYFQELVGRSVLSCYSLRFTVRLPDGGRADIVEDGGVVEGKLYQLPYEAVRYLYKREGVDHQLYRPAFVDVLVDGVVYKDVLTFIVIGKKEELAPPDHYAEEIIRGGNGCLSDEYIQRIEFYMRTLPKSCN
ncbi:gamma-glutamylcyclotransferase [Alkalihalobacterium alkalinitrilicum]|uniref:gamma-glutamylcyclotransferase n=1 Tax=Alkalihalobacterium alkalinitrilicum TaxID=427920 RepID=UPI000994C14F|nr:gamma-glutamylcyclotransferase family protein [Alkalihalobacterium alkalinitrilicum]